MPVVRQLRWGALVPQSVPIAVFAFVIHASVPRLLWSHSIFFAALSYLIICRILRATLTRDHIAGMAAYRAQLFDEAISHFQASYRFFSAHRRLDSFRSLLLGVASYNSYRVIALCNMAYCYTQIGQGHEAIKLYEQALIEAPDCMLAKASLNMLRSASTAPHAAQSA